MSETNRESLGLPNITIASMPYGESQYDADGPSKIAARSKVDYCLPEDVEPFITEHALIEAIQWMSRDASIADVGCSMPFLLIGLSQAAFTGRKVGVDPFVAQFNGMPYKIPIGTREEYLSLQDKSGENATEDFFIEMNGSNNDWPEIELFQSDANFIPVPSDSMDIVSVVRSMYHVPRLKQIPAILEFRRCLKKQYSNPNQVYGVLPLATSGEHCKIGMRRNELKSAIFMSKELGAEVVPPRPLSSGFTTEAALEVLTGLFSRVYLRQHETEVIFDSEERIDIVKSSFMTLTDQFKYIDKNGSERTPSIDLYESTIEEVVLKGLLMKLENGEPATDFISRSLLFASDRNLDLPDDYRPVTAPRDR